MKMTFLVAFLGLICVASPVLSNYQPNWSSIDSRPLPGWYDRAKIGIFLHWGVFSVPSFHSEWFWEDWRSAHEPEVTNYMKQNFRPNFTYEEFAANFRAEFWDPNQWAELFVKSGAKYVVLTSKHHEGYTLWPSVYSFNWNSMDVGPKRDLVGELAQAVRKHNLTFGVYHSLYEWYNPMYLADKANGYTTNRFVAHKIRPEMEELVRAYRPDIVWSDGDWDAPDSYWNSTDFLAWLYNESPVRHTVVTNDRWGRDISCHHGGFYTCTDRYNPGKLVAHKWENAMTLDRKSWGYRREARLADYLSFEELLTEVVSTVSCNGNILINIGPTSEGTIKPIFEERLTQLGAWLKVNGRAIYGSRPWTVQNDTVDGRVWYTQTETGTVHAHLLSGPLLNQTVLFASMPAKLVHGVSMLGHIDPLDWIEDHPTGGTKVLFPLINPAQVTFGYVFEFILRH